MAEEIKAGCARPTGGPVGEKVDDKKETPKQEVIKEVKAMVTVGKRRQILPLRLIIKVNLSM